MRSVIKLIGIILLFIFPPLLVNYFLVSINVIGESGMIISQLAIIAMSLGLIMIYLRGKKAYEAKTLYLIDQEKNLEGLRKLRDKRISYDSKANVTKAIMLKEFSEEEAAKLRKYTNKVADMDHYYSGFIKNSEEKVREEYKIRRDNFKKKYKHKKYAYTDYKGNIRESFKWLGRFFIILIVTSLVQKHINNKDLYVFSYIFQMAFGAGFMINTIIWLSRTLKSYWDKNYI